MSNVLVLEDQPAWGALVTSAIRNNRLSPCSLHTAATYGEAMRLIGQFRFDAALLDYRLEQTGPEGAKTGLDVARELRKVAPAATILLVTLTDPQRLAATCDELGVTLVEKGRPDLEDELVRELRSALRG